MDFKNTFTKAGKQTAFTFIEIMVASALGLLGATVVAVLYTFSSRSFLALDNYTDMCQSSQLALDEMSRDIRQAKQLTAYTTNSLTFTDVNGNPLQYTFNPGAAKLTRVSGGQTNTLLADCNSLQFWIYQPTPVSNAFACYTPAYVTNARVIQLTWACSRLIMGQTDTTESVESAQIAMRNH